MALFSYITSLSSPFDDFQKPKKLEDIPGVYDAPIPAFAAFEFTFTKPFYPASGMGPLGSRTFYSRNPGVYGCPDKNKDLYHRDIPEREFKKLDSTNPQEYDRDFYDRFGHSHDMNDYVHKDINVVIPKVKDAEMVQIEIRAEAGVTTETNADITNLDSKDNKDNSEIIESNIDYEKILGLPPLPVHLRYIKTTSPNFNFNDPSFDLLEYKEIRRREKLIEKLKAEMKNSS